MRAFFFGPKIFGLRTGISLGRFAGQPTSSAIDPARGFIYVVQGEPGLVKVGITGNPNQRLAQLQSASEMPLSFAWIGAPQGDVIAIEKATHAMLSKFRQNGEWFRVTASVAVGAIHSVAFDRGVPVLDLSVEQAEEIRQIACMPQRPPSSVLDRIVVGIVKFVLAAIVIGWLLVVLARAVRF